MNCRAVSLILLTMLGPCLLSGCGNPTATVSGEVTLDGKPLEDGIIVYDPSDGKNTAAQGKIEAGKYSVLTVPSSATVKISAQRVVGKRPDSDAPNATLIEIWEEQIPERYNTETELKFEVQVGKNTKDWKITSQ